VLAFLLVGLSASGASGAGPGDLDRSFSGDGRQTVNFGARDLAWDVVFQSGRKPVVAGWRQVESGGCCGVDRLDIALARLRSRGNLDRTFGNRGRVTTDRGNLGVQAAAIQADDKLLVAGFYRDRCFLARFKPTGTPDPRFGRNGIVKMDLGAGQDLRCKDVAVQENGRIVIAGASLDPTVGRWVPIVARFRRNGDLDRDFAGDGKATEPFSEPMNVSAVTIQPNGRIVIGGGSFDQASDAWDFAIARYTPGGLADSTFSGDGIETTDLNGGDDFAGAVAFSNGQLVLAGDTRVGAGSDFALARYDLAGDLDPEFGEGGIQTTDFRNGGDDAEPGLAVQRDGKLVLAGSTDSQGKSQDFALARYRTDGTLDPSFAGDGRRVTAFKGPGGDRRGDFATAVAIDRRGRIVAAGFSQSAFAIARYIGS
jgi:uncharacterized delta-60 repeat protein